MVTLAGEEISLYPKEFDVLHLFMQYPGWVFHKKLIYGYVIAHHKLKEYL